MAQSAPTLSRRAFLRGTAAALALPGLALRPARALVDPTSPFVKRVVTTPDKTYFTYPHSNAFLPDGSCVLARPMSNGVEYQSFDFRTGESKPITEVPGARMYFAISQAGLMAFNKNSSVCVVDVTPPNSPVRQVYADPPWRFHADCDISADGKALLITATKPERPQVSRAVMIDVQTGRTEVLAEAGWLIDHAHFSPFDPGWVCYANGTPKDYERTWVWHREKAPQGRALFNQRRPDGKVFDVGHERAMFHKPALLTVAYGSNSSARPCGLYEVSFEGSARLVSESMRDFHCNVSRDGRWAVVSLQGQYEQLSQRIDTNWLDKTLGFGISDVMLVNLRTGGRQFLYRSYNEAVGQPYEVQPSISPDGRWVALKNGRDHRVIGVEIDQSRLDAFLA